LDKGCVLLTVVAGGVLAVSPAHAQKAAPAQAAAPQTETPPANPSGDIIPDAEFEAQLPSLDPELGRPLEPIEDFPLPPADPVAGPELLPDAPVADPALVEPLPPLATFDVTTPPPGAADEERPAEIRYALEIEGLEEVNLEDRFQSLSALEDADGRATNAAQVSARAREDELLLLRMLRSEGYYDATGTVTVEQVPEQAGQLRVVVAAAPGERFKLGEIALTGAETVPPGLAREALKLNTGDPIVSTVVQAAEANVLLRCPISAKG